MFQFNLMLHFKLLVALLEGLPKQLFLFLLLLFQLHNVFGIRKYMKNISKCETVVKPLRASAKYYSSFYCNEFNAQTRSLLLVSKKQIRSTKTRTYQNICTHMYALYVLLLYADFIISFINSYAVVRTQRSGEAN